MRFTKKQWGIFFVSPDHLELIKDYVFTKGSQNKIYTPERMITVAIEAFLMNNGYKEHVKILREAKKPSTAPMMDSLKPKFKEAAKYIMENRGISEKEAVEWVLAHEKEVEVTF